MLSSVYYFILLLTWHRMQFSGSGEAHFLQLVSTLSKQEQAYSRLPQSSVSAAAKSRGSIPSGRKLQCSSVKVIPLPQKRIFPQLFLRKVKIAASLIAADTAPSQQMTISGFRGGSYEGRRISVAPDSERAFSQAEAYFSGRRVMTLTVEQSGRSSQILGTKSAQRSVTVRQKLSGAGAASATVFFAVLKTRFDTVDDGEKRFIPISSGRETLLGATILEEYLPHFAAIPSHIMPFFPLITST